MIPTETKGKLTYEAEAPRNRLVKGTESDVRERKREALQIAGDRVGN